MSRGYPRFLFSNPQNTQDKGPFIIHLLFPKKLYRVEWQFLHGDADLHEIEEWGDKCTEAESRKVLRALIKWFDQQLKSKEIIYPLSAKERAELFKKSLPKEIQKNIKTKIYGQQF